MRVVNNSKEDFILMEKGKNVYLLVWQYEVFINFELYLKSETAFFYFVRIL